MWTRGVISQPDARKLNAILSKLRNSTFPRGEYSRLATLWKQAFSVNSPFLPEWDEWVVIFDRFRIGRRFPQDNLREAIAFLNTRGALSPPSSGPDPPRASKL